MSQLFYFLTALLVAYLPRTTHAHGRMLMPPSRMSGYLAGLPMPPNYNDHEMNCGGRYTQWVQSGGRCGICGEPWPSTKNYERPNGVMVQHRIKTGTYLENQVILVRLQITVAHKGWHEFRLCNVATSGGVEATQSCLDKIVLADEYGQKRFTKGTTSAGYYDFLLVLPERLTCDQCVLQWKWKCGNDWGCDANRTCCVGCGDKQEEFYACADVTINPRNIRFTTTTTARTTTTWRYTTTTRSPATQYTTRPWWTTRAPRTTMRTSTTTTTKPATTVSYNYNILYDYLKKNPSNFPGVSSIKFPTPGNSNTNYQPPKFSNRFGEGDLDFLYMVLGRHAVVVNSQDGLSIPVPMSYNSTSSTDESNADLISDQLTKDRFCAMCQYQCRYEACYNYCPQVCSHKRR